MSNKSERWHGIAKSVVELLLRKNADYGDSYKDPNDPKATLYGLAVRLGDKANRFRTLAYKRVSCWDIAEGNVAAVQESVEDTLKDLIGYALLALDELSPGEPAARDEGKPPLGIGLGRIVGM